MLTTSRHAARRALVLLPGLLVGLRGLAAAQDAVPRSNVDVLVNYGYLGSFFDPGIAGYAIENRNVRVLNVPLTFTLRDWEEGGWGLRLTLAGVLGVENVDAVGDIPSARLGAFAFIPGIEVPVLTGRSLLRPFLDMGAAFSLEDEPASPGTVGIGTIGLRTEHVFPWRRWELGLEPRAHYSLTWSKSELRDDYAVVGLRADARHPLFHVGDHTLAGVLYVQPAWFVEAMTLAGGDRDGTVDVRQQIEIGAGYNWRGDPPTLWILDVPPVSIGYSFGDGLEGIRLRVGGDRLLHLPAGTWSH